jgi:methionyl-tRNA formyltransferase
MRVLLLTPIPHQLADTIEAAGDRYSVSMERPYFWPDGIDFIVSFGYRYIIQQEVIDYYRGRLINIHISFLPWNRGADPNFWSWFDRTPKGVSIHVIEAGVDSGEIICRLPLGFKEPHKETLRSSYLQLIDAAACLFRVKWPEIRRMNWNGIRHPDRLAPNGGTYHRASDKDKWMNKLPLSWDTPVLDVEELGLARKDN